MLSIFDWFGYQLTMEERYGLIKKAGFSQVMILWGHRLGRGVDYRLAPEIAREAGLAVENIHAPTEGQHALWRDDLTGQNVEQCYDICLEDCRSLGVPTLVIHIPGDDCPVTPSGLQRMQRLTQRAEDLEVNLALENVQNVRNLGAVFGAIGSPRLGLCYDCCHHYNGGVDTDILELYGRRLMGLHLHDNSGASRSCCVQHRLPFDGDIPWAQVMEKISATGYRGATALEPMYWDYQELPPDVFLYRAFEKAKSLDRLRGR